MKARIALLIVAAPLALAGCTKDTPTERPRLLANDTARIGDLDWIQTQHALHRQAETVTLELTSCWREAEASETPRLVIGEPVCVFGSSSDVPRID